MTYLQLEEVSSDDDLLARQIGPTVKCSWCFEIIRLDGNELALAMCQSCYDRMPAEFLRAHKRRSRRPTPTIAKYVSPVPQRRKMPLPA
jgi:hypothetical protein